MATTPFEQGKSEAAFLVKGLPVYFQRWHEGYFRICDFPGEDVLLQYLLIRPAARPVNFHHHGFRIFDADLVDTVFITVKGQEAPVTKQSGGLNQPDNGLRVKAVVGRQDIIFLVHRGVFLD
jgi:hypothetical protein